MRHCAYCEAELVRREREQERDWIRRRFCSRQCASMGNIEDSTMGGHSQRAMTYAEIATELGLTVNQVRGAEFTALRKLKHNLALRKLWAIVRAA